METVRQHFRKEEQPFIENCYDWVRNVEQRYAPYLTSFLNPRERLILQSIVNNNEECHVQFDGGYDQAERKRALIYPSYFQTEENDFELTLLEVNYPEKFSELKHSQILGSVLGIGIKRETIGDIVTDGNRWQFFVEKHLTDYLSAEVQKIGRTTVQLTPLPLEEQLTPLDEWNEKQLIVSSLRLDAMIASVYNVSRQSAKNLVNGNKVKVNWSEETRPAFDIEMGDIVSVRRYGRFQLVDIQGKTRKEKLKVNLKTLTPQK